MGSVTCASCGFELTDDPADPSERVPCPKCGSRSRASALEAKAAAFAFAGSAVLEFVTYPQRLIGEAEKLVADGEFSIAVIVAHLATEVAVSRRMTEAFASRGIGDLEDAVGSFFSGSSLGNDRIRDLYIALTGDRITTQPFWSDFHASSRLRNKIAHAGAIATKPDAETAICVSSAVIKHLGKWGGTA